MNKHITTSLSTLDIYKEKGKVVISKRSNFLGVVYLETPEEIRKVASYLYRLVIEDDK